MKRLVILCSALAVLGPSLAPAVHAQAVQYSGKTRVLNVGKLIIDSSKYQGNLPPGLNQQPEDTAPYIFYLMDQRNDLKPRGWVLQNPLAPSTVTQTIRDRWANIDPIPAHVVRYTVGSPITKDMAAYWEVKLSDASLNDLLKFDLLFVSSHTPGQVFTPQEQEKLRKLVEAGGVVWLDDCWKFRISDVGRFFLPNLQFHGSHIKNPPPSFGVVADPAHPLLNTPNVLTQQEINRLGDKNIGEYYHTGFVPPGQITGIFNDTTPPAAPDLSQPQPDVLAPVVLNSWTATAVPGGPYPYISAGQYGAGYVIVTSGDIGDAINANCAGTTGYNIPGPDYDKNGGSVCGNATSASDPEDLKFAYNALSWASNFGTYRRGPEHSAYAPQSVTLPLSRQWQFGLKPGEAVESDPILLRGNVYVTTTLGRLICLLQDPSQIQGATGPVELWESPALGSPLSSITAAEVGQPANLQNGSPARSLQLLLVSGGGQVFAYNAGYNPTQPQGPANPLLVWKFPANGPLPAPGGNGPDKIAGPPVYMDGSVFFTTENGAVWEINPQDGTATRQQIMPTDPNNGTDDLPASEPILHYVDPNNWQYTAAPPAAGYVVDRSTSTDDPTLVLGVYATTNKLNAAPDFPQGALLQFPVRIANEHHSIADARPTAPVNNQQGPYLVPLSYHAIKNPELVQFSLNGTTLVTKAVKSRANGGPAGSGTMRISIQWPDGSNSASYYLVDNNGAMAADYPGNGALPPGTWEFVAPTPATKPIKWEDAGNTVHQRNFYDIIAIAPTQYKPNPLDPSLYDGNQPVALTPDCVIHIDYDVDEADPIGAQPASNGPAYHPELGILPLQKPNNNPAGSASLGPPSIGLDDSVYFGSEDGILYSISYAGPRAIAINWKYYVGPTAWTTTAGKVINPVLLADSDNNFTTDIQAPPSQAVIRTAPTVGNGRVFVTVTDLPTNQSRVMAFNSLEFQEANAQTNANGTQTYAGATVTFHLNPPDPNNANAPSSLRSAQNPVSMIAQFDPIRNQLVTFLQQRQEFTVDPATQTITLNQFGKFYSNLPIYVWYNLSNGQIHSLRTNPASPPDEVHNVFPGVMGVPYDSSQKYMIPADNSAYMLKSLTYAGGAPSANYPHPFFRFPSDQICNLLWQFPDPVWNTGGVNWAQPVFPAPNNTSVLWSGPIGPSGVLVQPFAGTSIGSPPNPSISDASPVLVGDSVLIGVSKLTAPQSLPAQAVSNGFMALPADPRNGLVGYTDPENVGIYNYTAVQPPAGGSVPPGLVVNNPNNVVTNALNLMSNLKATLLAPYPPAVSYYSVRDFAGEAGMISTPAVTANGAVIGAGTGGANNVGTVTLLGAPVTVALDAYRLMGLDAGGNITFEVPATTKTSLPGADNETTVTDPNLIHTTTTSFNRPSSMQRLDASDVLIADTGNDRVVQTDLSGTVGAEITRYFDNSKVYQPGDLYLIDPGDPTATPAIPPGYAYGNLRLTNPTDAFQWTSVTTDQTGSHILITDRLIVDAGNYQVVAIEDRRYLDGPFADQYVELQKSPGPLGQPVSVRWYHVKVWGTQTPASGAQYHYRNAIPFLVQVNDAAGQHQYMPFVLATVTNYGITLPAGPNQPLGEAAGASIVLLYGPTDAAGAALPPAVAGSIKAASTSFVDLRQDPNYPAGDPRNSTHVIQNPVFLRQYFDADPNVQGNVRWHLLFIDQGAFLTPTGQDSRAGNWGAYDLVTASLPANTIPNAPNLLAANFLPGAVGSLDDVDYANLTDGFTNPYADIFYAGPPAFPIPSYAPTSIEVLPMTNTVLITNSYLNQLADPTRIPPAFQLNDPRRYIGPGGEVLLLTGQSFFHPAVSGPGSPSYQPDGSANPSILFRSIPVQGSYLLQQVVAADRR